MKGSEKYMGVVSDAIDSLEDWLEDLFQDAVKSQFDSISAMLKNTFDTTTNSNGLISTFLQNILHSLQAHHQAEQQYGLQ